MKSEKMLAWVTIGLIILSILFVFLWLPPYQAQITSFTVHHPVLAPAILILWRFIGVVIPPIPAGILAFTLIPILGWFWVYVYSTIGLLAGAIVAFLLARKFREPIVKRFVPLQDLNKWEGKLSGQTELWGFILIRLTTGPVMDFISYLAGLTRLSFWRFFVATLISLVPSMASYYIGAKAYDKLSGENPYLTVGLLIVVVIVGFFYKDLWKKYKKKK